MAYVTCVSAPGKVLMTGGYVVLERPNPGIVVSVSARVFSAITTSSGQSMGADIPHDAVRVVLRSLQYKTKSVFDVLLSDGCKCVYTAEEEKKKNVFVETVIRFGLAYISAKFGLSKVLDLGRVLEITILGDNNFYSQRGQLDALGQANTRASLHALPNFLPFLDPAAQPKTGLGSSAALVASLCGALLEHYRVVHLDGGEHHDAGSENHALHRHHHAQPTARELVHNLSQLSHCVAQGKIGSGFDVSAAVYGTQEYTRFSPELLSEFSLSATQAIDGVKIGDLVERCRVGHVHEDIKGKWDNQIKPFSLPEELQMVIGDIASGASTPVMVSKLLQWRDKDPSGQSGRMWRALVAGHTQCAGLLHHLSVISNSEAHKHHSKAMLQRLAREPATEWAGHFPGDLFVQQLLELRTAYEALRHTIREVSTASGVPIEPHKLRPLLDATIALPGVLIAGCPGAGGEDAIFCLCVGEEAAAGVEKMWKEWKQNDISVCALDVTDGKGETSGLRKEPEVPVKGAFKD